MGALAVDRIAGALGAELSGLDLTGALTDVELHALRSAVVQHKVVFLRDQPYATEHLVRLTEQLGGLGFQYEPWLDFDPAADRRNIEWINKQPIERRKAYAAAVPKCGDEASRLTYLAAAVGDIAANGATPPDLPPREVSDDDRREADIAFVLEHRDVLDRLVMDLEVE